MNSSPLCVDANLVIRLVSAAADERVRSLWEAWDAGNRRIVAPAHLFYEVSNALVRHQRAALMSGQAVRLALRPRVPCPSASMESLNSTPGPSIWRSGSRSPPPTTPTNYRLPTGWAPSSGPPTGASAARRRTSFPGCASSRPLTGLEEAILYLIPFYVVEPELAGEETRVMHLLAEQDGLPVGTYGLLEHYCPDPDCDCRRVMLTVVEEDDPTHSLASINYAFDRDDPMPGPFIDRTNRQTEHAETLLRLVREAVLVDPHYLARLERHYALVKRAASDPDHPAYVELRELIAASPKHAPHRPVASPTDSVGRNDPCPCGSGRKYKHCCMRKDA